MKLNLTDTTIRNAMDDYTGALETRTALKLSAYLFTRPSELRQMEWTEIDLESGLWSIPASKMKAGRPHLVPLAKQAIALKKSHHLPHIVVMFSRHELTQTSQ